MAVSTMSKAFDHDAYRERRPQPEGAFLVEYEGAVLDLVEENHYDDSDFFAIVWDEAAQKVTRTQYATTRGWTYPNSAKVDATDEVKAKAAKWYEGVAYDRKKLKDREAAEKPAVGKKVRVTRGRTRGKRPIANGTEAWVAAVVKSRFETTYTFYGDRVPKDELLLQVGDELVFLTADRTEVVDPEQYLTPDAELREEARRAAAGKVNYRGYFHLAWML